MSLSDTVPYSSWVWGRSSSLYLADGTLRALASFMAVNRELFVKNTYKLCNITNVVDHCTAIVLEAGGVAHEAEGGHLAGDPDVADLSVVFQPPGGRVEQPFSSLD